MDGWGIIFVIMENGCFFFFNISEHGPYQRLKWLHMCGGSRVGDGETGQEMDKVFASRLQGQIQPITDGVKKHQALFRRAQNIIFDVVLGVTQSA